MPRYAATPYTAADNYWRNNISNGLSLAAGFMGADGFISCAVPGNRTIYLCGDTALATGAGQRSPWGTNSFNNVAPQASGPRNSLIIINGNDLSTNPARTVFGDFFPATSFFGIPHWRWPTGAFTLNSAGTLYVIGVFAFDNAGTATQSGSWIIRYDTLAGAPNTWAATEEFWTNPDNFQLASGPVKGTDGNIYCWGPSLDSPNDWYAMRWSELGYLLNNFTTPEWWDADARRWSTTTPRANRRGVFNAWPASLFTRPAGGTIKQLADGRWRLTCIPYISVPGYTGRRLAVSHSPVPYDFPPPTEFYAIPDTADLALNCYNGLIDAASSAGKAAGQELIVYNVNSATKQENYFPRYLVMTESGALPNEDQHNLTLSPELAYSSRDNIAFPGNQTAAVRATARAQTHLDAVTGQIDGVTMRAKGVRASQ